MIIPCTFCGRTLKKTHISQDYFKCVGCGSLVVKQHVPFEYESYFDGIYLDVKQHIGILSSDKKHYEKLFNDADIKKSNIPSFKTIWSYGGGFPKLESNLNFENIEVFDLNADKYLSMFDTFKEYFPKIHDVNYNIEIISPKSIGFGRDINRDDLVSYVHFLEHFKEQEVIDFINETAKTKASILIYQPNANAATNSNWCHFVKDQHLSIISFQMAIKLLEAANYKILLAKEFSDDMFIIANR